MGAPRCGGPGTCPDCSRAHGVAYPLPTCNHAMCRPGVPCRYLPPAAPLTSHSQSGHTLTDADVERVAEAVARKLAERLAR